MVSQRILTVEEVAESLQITENTIQRKSWRQKTGCPLKKRGKRLYVLEKEFIEWLRG